MGRFIKTLILILIGFDSFAQCDSLYIEKKIEDGCVTVEMSAYRFAKFYKAEKNLSLVGKYADSVKVYMDSVEVLNNKIETNENAKDSLLKEKDDLFNEEITNCEQLSLRMSDQNGKLENKVARVKKQRNVLGGTTLLLAIILICLF